MKSYKINITFFLRKQIGLMISHYKKQLIIDLPLLSIEINY